MADNSKSAVFRMQFNELGRNFTKPNGDIEAWSELTSNVNEFTFQSSNGVITVHVDWGNLMKYMNEAEQNFFDADKIKTQRDYDLFIERFKKYSYTKYIEPIKLCPEIEISVCGDCKDYSKIGYVINVLFQIFIVMNISVPGSCEFSSTITRVYGLNECFSDEKLLFKLGGSIIESATQIIEELQWPNLHKIPVIKVVKWLRGLGLAQSGFASSNIERAIFGMLHSCLHDDVDATTLIWLSQALEALYDTPKIGISKILRERIFLVLGKPNRCYTKAKKMINSFYDYRSRYVHGDIDLLNPLLMRLSDKRLDDFYSELFQHVDISMILTIASFQELVIKNGKSFGFSENFSLETI